MGVLSDVFVADPEEVVLAEGGPTVRDRLQAVDVKGLEQVKLGALGQLLLEGKLDTEDPGSYGPTYDALVDEMSEPSHEFSDEEWVYPIPERLAVALAELPDERIPLLVEAWGATEEFALDDFDGDDVRDYVVELRKIARLARDAGKRLYLWMSL